MEMKNQDPSVWTATQMTEKTNKKQKNKGVIGKLKSGLMTKQIEHLHLAQIAHSSQNTLSTSSSTVRLLFGGLQQSPTHSVLNYFESKRVRSPKYFPIFEIKGKRFT